MNNDKVYRFTRLLQSQGWMSPAYACIDEDGCLRYLSDTEPPQFEGRITKINGAALPGFQNAHSHAFQYAMAGKAEMHPEGIADDFWSWRQAMYECALSYTPQEMKDVALQLYKMMLRNGYTHVSEFHYVHHDKNGKPYNNLAQTGESLIEAAKEAGIHITLVPVFYQQGNFGVAPFHTQRRFICRTTDDYFKLLESSKKAVEFYELARLGFGVHSLRAVAMPDIIRTYIDGPDSLPFHLHAAEQLKEVSDCIAFSGQRPVEWLLNHLNVNSRFHIVHATHMTESEIKRLADSGASVVLCPGTEGNLGDGVFPFSAYTAHQGNWSIGTDSHISLNPLEDLRWLDYKQRLISHKRNTFNDGASHLIEASLRGGRKAMGIEAEAFFEIGKSFDAAVFNLDDPRLGSVAEEFLKPVILYTADSSSLAVTIVNGEIVWDNRR